MSPADAEDLFISAINEISLELKIFLKSIGFIFYLSESYFQVYISYTHKEKFFYQMATDFWNLM